MNQQVQATIDSLTTLGDKVFAAYGSDQTLSEIWGYNYLPLNRWDLANLAFDIANRLKTLDEMNVDDNTKLNLEKIPTRVALFINSGLQYLFNGNNAQYNSGNTYISLINWINDVLKPLFAWEALNNNKLYPKELTKRLRTLEADLNEITPRKEELQSQIEKIQQATEAAESLPTDLQSLKEARQKISKLSTDSAKDSALIEEFRKKIDEVTKHINEKKEEGDRLIAQSHEAYRITTSAGLAGAFHDKADALNFSIIWWVVGLIVALIGGGVIGYYRFDAFSKTITNSHLHWGVIWMEFILSIFGLAAPIWFAWLATKQISQRFRLSEDYAFKASVAKAYEGYRKEAVNLDEQFAVKLFNSALDRLDEAPLRLVDDETHGSPMQELVNSKAFQKAFENVPGFKDQVFELMKSTLAVFKKGKKETILPIDSSSSEPI